MQSARNVAHSVYRIVFRRGSPQRIQYSDRRLVGSIVAAVVLLIAALRVFFGASMVETGLALFVVLSGIYIGAALLTRRAPRMRLRQTLLALLLILSAACILLIAASPLAGMTAPIRTLLAGAVGLACVAGLANSLQYAYGPSLAVAWASALGFVAVLGTYYLTMRSLLEIVFT